MAKSDKLAYADQTDDGVVTDIKGYIPKGYDGEFGVYSSNIYFVGDFEEELATQKFYDPAPPMPEMAEVDRQKGQQNGYKNLSFKSATGENDCYNPVNSDFWAEEDPDNYKYTPAYYECPQIRALIDWFQCPLTRVRIFQQQPGHHMPLHTDFDNQKGMTHGQTVRIFVQLNENKGDFHYRFQTSDSDFSVQLQKGQWLAFNQDKVAHATWNSSDTRVRNAFMFVAKRNEWLDNIMKNHDKPYFVDCRELAKEKKIA
jgi:hypothetical protein